MVPGEDSFQKNITRQE